VFFCPVRIKKPFHASFVVSIVKPVNMATNTSDIARRFTDPIKNLLATPYM
jgi:hypothetical protein